MSSTSPFTAPIRLATWPSAPGRSGSQTRMTTVCTVGRLDIARFRNMSGT